MRFRNWKAFELEKYFFLGGFLIVVMMKDGVLELF
jgi:hypothetical protein